MKLRKLERYLIVYLLGPGPHLMKKNLPGRGLKKVEKQWTSGLGVRLLAGAEDIFIFCAGLNTLLSQDILHNYLMGKAAAFLLSKIIGIRAALRLCSCRPK